MICRAWWKNCAVEPDCEILAIDRLEDRILPLPAGIAATRNLISTLEVCHHKAERWVHNIIEAIGSGTTAKGLGTRSPVHRHPTEELWCRICEVLSGWCAGDPDVSLALIAPGLSAARLLDRLGPQSPLKTWQVQRVVDKIRSFKEGQRRGNVTAGYTWLLYSEQPEHPFAGTRCPAAYRDSEQFWLATACTMIEDTHNATPIVLSLGLAIDMLWPCHWNFLRNLEIVLGAIGGDLKPGEPFTACGRNIHLLPARNRLLSVARSLGVFARRTPGDAALDRLVLSALGKPTQGKIWLAASLDKTLRLQLDPPASFRELYALACPDWLEGL